MQLLHEYLLQKHANNRQVVVFVEEAQGMPIETLEEIRLLSNLETNDHKLLQMVLFGQPELDVKLRTTSIRQLKERITHSFYLDPFPRSEIYQYLNFRMRAVGYRGPDIFSQPVANRIEKKSQGLTRRINILADKALLAAFAEGGHGITSRHINIAARDSDFGQAYWHMPRWMRNTVLGSGLLLLVIVAVWIGTLIPQVNEKPAASTTASPTVAVQQPRVEVLAAKTTAITPAVAVAQVEHESVLPAILQQRMTTTEQWLNNVADDHYSIQLSLIETSVTATAERYIQRAAALIGMENLYVYEALIRGKPVYSVLYSDYPSREMAVLALLALPENLRADGAFVRPLKGVKGDRPNENSGELQEQTGITE